ncbi:peptide deformylase [Agathobaculum sp. NTUH-O15-33]|uniref:peptide deformylase n=1 Tax=Agathobaculum sp. NTUH-O15-33 TaxID=3079302 RepID=UPI002958BE6E|nr:peptide deformylase [Agathobaculum sp. NTUH-O15-33]WNX85387.1 peptide deformylase [Agathobaculum sp. NTUH-O15-33]
MALRKILTEEDEQLKKRSRKVEKFDDRLHQLIDDMRETLENAGGVGLAAPQVGILRRVVVLLDVNQEPEEVVELVNPEVIETRGEERVIEGCLSVPGRWGYVTRPTWAKIRAQDRDGNWFEREGEGMVAQCFCHETEHLDGHLFTEKVEEYVDIEALRAENEAEAEGGAE